MEDRGGTYQICGPNTFSRYGFDEQVPTRVYPTMISYPATEPSAASN